MPGLNKRQHQFVRYEGRTEAEPCVEGWRAAHSPASRNGRTPLATPLRRANVNGVGNAPSPPEGGAAPLADPTGVQLRITSAPAHFCLPQKNDRQFKPAFHVQVRVQHDPARSLQLPLRVKAFAVTQEERQALPEWLPPELRAAPPPILGAIPVPSATAGMDLKGPTVIAHTFRSYIALPPADGSGRAAGDAADGRGRPLPMFPTRVVAEESVTASKVLVDPDCMMPRDDDPNMATPMGSAADVGTCIARFEFKGLEFARPTRMNPVYLVFACVIGGRDLLYTIYDVPSISICRADQRTKALSRLGLPSSVYMEVTELQEGPVRPHRPVRRRVRRLQPLTEGAAVKGAFDGSTAVAGGVGGAAPLPGSAAAVLEATGGATAVAEEHTADDHDNGGESHGECRGMEDIWADVAEGCTAGAHAHSSNASVPPPTAAGSTLHRPASKGSHDGSQEGRGLAGDSSPRGAACTPSPAAPMANDPASVDEVLKSFLQSNDKLTSLSLARWNGEPQGRQGEAPPGIGSLRLPSDIPVLEEMVSDVPALEARQVEPPVEGGNPDNPNRLMNLPSLHSNPTLSLSFSRFMAALDDDLRALGAPPAPPDAPAATGTPPATAAQPASGPDAPPAPQADASPRASLTPQPCTPQASETAPLAAATPVHKSPQPLPTLSAPENHHTSLERPKVGDDVPGECKLQGGPQERAQEYAHQAPRAPMQLMSIPRGDTEQLELLLAENKPESGVAEESAPPPQHGSVNMDQVNPTSLNFPRQFGSGSGGGGGGGRGDGAGSAGSGVPAFRVRRAAAPQSSQGKQVQPNDSSSALGAVQPPAAVSARLPRRGSVDEPAPAWMSPRSATTVSAPRRATPDHVWVAPHPPRQQQPPLQRACQWGASPQRPASGPAALEADAAESVSQAQVHGWLNETYLSSGLTRPLSCMDYQALLSLAGFPALAGLDTSSRIPPGQFHMFQRHFSAAVDLLRSAAALWNTTDPRIISGFDMDCRTAEAALATQPIGTFICRICMRQAGCLVLSCKVDPNTASTDGAEVMHVGITTVDLRRSDPSQLILSLPYASHVLDVGTRFRVDKRAVLSGHQVSITLAFGMLAVQAAVSDNSVADRGARDGSQGGLKRPLEELAVQAADSAVRKVQQEAAAAKRRRGADDAPADGRGGEPRQRAALVPQMPGQQLPVGAADVLVPRPSHSEFTRWAGHSAMSNSVM